MAKVQGKKAAGARKAAPAKVAARVKKAVKAVKKRVDARKPPKAKTASKPAAKTASKPAPKPAPKAVAKPKVAPKAAAKPAPKPKAAAAKTVAPVKAAAKAVAKTVKAAAAKVVAKVAPKAAVAAPAARPAAPATPPAEEKKRTRRSRLRLTSNGTPAAAWFAQPGEKPRSSSFIPAPPRAEAPSLVAAPPASSDRLIHPEDVAIGSVRTVPVRVDVEQNGGRIDILVNPLEVAVRPGDGIEWDFRYLRGADVSVDEIVIELDKPSPFSATVFRSRRPGSARPHRQLSGAAGKSALGKRSQYTIRAFNAFKTELASTKPSLIIHE